MLDFNDVPGGSPGAERAFYKTAAYLNSGKPFHLPFSEVSKLLDLDESAAADALEEGEAMSIPSLTGDAEEVASSVNERGLWALVAISSSPYAHMMRKWLLREILPIIREPGGLQRLRPSTTRARGRFARDDRSRRAMLMALEVGESLFFSGLKSSQVGSSVWNASRDGRRFKCQVEPDGTRVTRVASQERRPPIAGMDSD